MGLEPFLVASTVEGLLAQRLVRRVCADCRREVRARDGEFGDALPKDLGSFFRGAGCDACRGTGYRGRVGLFELMVVDDALREMILRRESAARLKRYAAERGMRTLREDGWDRVRAGVTTPEEVFRITKADKY
jgi:type II secretory ATPase GspE/PulE/Tfp pilus assembly ATPase PilB-like protein